MTERKLNDFTPQPPPPNNQTGWRAFPITVDFPADEQGNTAMTFDEEAKKAISDCGLEDKQHELLCWAFGDDYDGQLIRNLRTRWNERHGEIFQLELTQSVYDQFCKIAAAYSTRNGI